MRFKKFSIGKEYLELGRIYKTDGGFEVGPFDEITECVGGPAYPEVNGGKDPHTFDVKIDGEWFCWWDTGTTANPNAEKYGEIVAVEAKNVEEALN